MPATAYKRCPRCEQALPLEAFARDRSKKTGRTSHCKACINAKCKRYYSAHREERLAYARAKTRVRASAPKPYHALEARQCETCGNSYQPHRKDQRHCSTRCNRKLGPTVTIPCEHCGQPVVKAKRDLARNPSTYCDRACAVRSRAFRTGKTCPLVFASCPICRETFQIRGNTRTCKKSACRYRARERAAHAEKFTAESIYERDGWRCQLCGNRVKPKAQVPEDMAPTIDHIIPLALGGDHTRANVQTAHFICNSRKGTRPASEQLLIFG